jgi:MFS family permease
MDAHTTSANEPVSPSASLRAGISIAGILFLAAADMTIVSTLLPSIAASIGGEALFPWLMSIFMAAMALSGMCAGALADRHGIRTILTLAVSIFLGASALAGLAPDIHMLLLARLAQGIGAGMIIVLSYSSLSLLYGLAQHGKAQGMIGLTWGVAAVIGPLLGLAALHFFSWRFLFLINVPIGLVCLAVFRTCFPKLSFVDRRPFDWPAQMAFGALLFIGMLALSAPGLGLAGTKLAALLTVAAVSLTLLLVRVLRQPAASPLPLPFLRDRGLIALVFIVPGASMGLYAAITFLPLVLAGTPDAAARLPLGITAAAASFVVSSAVSSRFVDRHGRRWP